MRERVCERSREREKERESVCERVCVCVCVCVTHTHTHTQPTNGTRWYEPAHVKLSSESISFGLKMHTCSPAIEVKFGASFHTCRNQALQNEPSKEELMTCTEDTRTDTHTCVCPEHPGLARTGEWVDDSEVRQRRDLVVVLVVKCVCRTALQLRA